MSAIDDALRRVAESDGWTPANAGEARVAMALQRHGVKADAVWQQFRIGPWRLDFAWPEWRLALEADGWVHTNRPQQLRDRKRDAQLRSWGWIVARVDVDDDALDDRVAAVVATLRRMEARGER